MKWRWVSLVFLASTSLSAQSLLDVRGIGMASDLTTASDLPSLFSNPAGLVTIQNWQVNTTNGYITPSRVGFFGNIGFAHRFYPNNIAAFAYAPSRELELEFLTTTESERFNGTTTVSYEMISDRRIKYQEPVILGYGFSPFRGLSIGISAAMFNENIDEFTTTIETRESSRFTSGITRENFSAGMWNFNTGLIYHPLPGLGIGVVAQNLLSIRESEFPDKYRKYAFVPRKLLRFGASVRPLEDFLLSGEFDTEKRFNVGVEMNALAPTSPFVIRIGSWFDFSQSSALNALSFGSGYKYKFVSFDASYITFIDKEFRNGGISESRFSTVSSLDVNQYTSDRFSFSVSIDLGSLRDAIARIENLHLSNTIFPASYRIHAIRPLGFARVRNLTEKPVKVRLRFYVRRLMDFPTESGEYYLEPEEVKEIPFTAEFNESILSLQSQSLLDSEIGVVASEVDDYEDVLRTKILVHGRNSWNGDPLMLKYFVTPKDPSVIQFTRKALSYNRDFLESAPGVLRRLEQARTVFNSFANMLTYIADPRTHDIAQEVENVQYPAETLELRGGDCDDFTVCYTALLNSLGFETAFVDVRGDSIDASGNSAHIYMLFDTGVPSSSWQKVSRNEKKIVLRKNSTGSESVWIPVETTAITGGFDAAWEKGALQYLRDVEYNLGILRGKVKIVDVYQTE